MGDKMPAQQNIQILKASMCYHLREDFLNFIQLALVKEQKKKIEQLAWTNQTLLGVTTNTFLFQGRWYSAGDDPQVI